LRLDSVSGAGFIVFDTSLTDIRSLGAIVERKGRRDERRR